MKILHCTLPESLYGALVKNARKEYISIDHSVVSALVKRLETTLHTLFRASTSSALVGELYQEAVAGHQFFVRRDARLREAKDYRVPLHPLPIAAEMPRWLLDDVTALSPIHRELTLKPLPKCF